MTEASLTKQTSRKTMKLDAEIHAQLKGQAKHLDMTMSDYLVLLLNSTTISTSNNSTTILIDRVKEAFKVFAENPTNDNEWDLSQAQIALSGAFNDDPILSELLRAATNCSQYAGRTTQVVATIRKGRLEKLPQVYRYIDAIGLIMKGLL